MKKILILFLLLSSVISAQKDSLNVFLNEPPKGLDLVSFIPSIVTIFVLFVGALFNIYTLKRTIINQREIEQAKLDADVIRKHMEYINNIGSQILKSVYTFFNVSAERTRLKRLSDALGNKPNVPPETIIKLYNDTDLTINMIFDLISNAEINFTLMRLNMDIDDRNGTNIVRLSKLLKTCFTININLYSNLRQESEELLKRREIDKKRLLKLAEHFTDILSAINDRKREEMKSLLTLKDKR